MKRNILKHISICCSTLVCLSIYMFPVQAANDSFVGPVNLTQEELQWVNDTALTKEIVQTADEQFLYQIERDPFVCAVITDYTGNNSDIVFHDYADYVRVSSSRVDLSDRDNITSVTYNGAYHFNGYADNFKGCKNLETLTVTVPFSERLIYLYDLSDDFVKTPSGSCYLIGSFADCTNLKTITLPHAAEKVSCMIGEGVFEGCTALKELDVSGYWSIYEDAFLNCTALEKVMFNENVKEIQEHAFGYIKDTDGTYQRYDGLTIYGVTGTVAETYAKENDIPFVAIEPTVPLSGDATCDNTVDVADAVLIARFLAEDSEAFMTEQGRRNADYNADGDITPDDISLILKKIARLI